MTETIEQRWAQVGRAQVYYEVAGSGPDLVLIHGLAGSGRWWAANVPFLARRFRVHVVDLVGFGRSRGDGPFSLAEAARIVGAWMRQLGIGPAHVIGHSMGGRVAAELAADAPELVERLVLVDAAAAPFDARLTPGPLAALGTLPRIAAPRFLRLLLNDAASAGPATIARAMADLLTADIGPKLERITAPTLVIWGEHDLLVPIEIGRRLAGRIRDARLAVLPKTGHNPMIERPETFNRLVDNFLHSGVISSDTPLATQEPPANHAIIVV